MRTMPCSTSGLYFPILILPKGNDRMIQNRIVVDTNILLDYPQILTMCEDVVICDIVVEELDNIIHGNRSDETKYQARVARNAIMNCETKTFHIMTEKEGIPQGWDKNKNDNLIILCAKQLDATLYTNDLLMQIKANSMSVPHESYHGETSKEYYKGFKELVLYSHEYREINKNRNENPCDLLINEYLIIRDKEDNEVVGMYKWTDTGLISVGTTKFSSAAFGTIEPRDVYQAIAMDSLLTAPFTVLTGVAGTAKTLLAMTYAFDKLKTTKCSRIVIVHNPAPLKGAVEIGYLPGTLIEKLCGGTLGEILGSKLGDQHEIERYVNEGKIHIIPTSNIRGFETQPDEILFMTEAQNCDIYTIKTLLQRAGEGCKVILEGDSRNQIDAKNCSYNNNGMNRAIDVFKGSDLFSCVELQEIYRSRICELADKM